jgi:UDP-glucuronate decarboxylase
VDDLIGGLELLMESPASITGPCNLGNPHEVAIEEIAREVLAYTKSSSSLCFEPLPKDDPKRRKPVIETALRKLGWRPRVPLRDGLQATIAYFALRTATPEFVTVPGPSPGPPSQGRGRLTLASQQ